MVSIIMSKSKIPIRPPGTFKLSQQEQEAITWHIISGLARTEVYRRFVRPDLETSKTALDKLTKMFFEDKEVKRYMEEYQKTLDMPGREDSIAFGKELKDLLGEDFCLVPCKDLSFVENPTVVGLGDSFAGGLLPGLLKENR